MRSHYTLSLLLTIVILISSGQYGAPIASSAIQKQAPVKIGLLITDSSSMAAVNGASVAIQRANEQGGINGRPLQLVVRSMEGPWGTGSKQAVSLIFEEKVWALMGSHDGRNAHLVEQAATKSIVPMVSAWSADPTLTQAFVPWFFNCIPTDKQQAESLSEEIYFKRKLDRVAVVTDNSNYDSEMASDFFLKQVVLGKHPDPEVFDASGTGTKYEALTEKILRSNPGCLVLFCSPVTSAGIIKLLKQKRISIPVYGSLLILDENLLSSDEMEHINDVLKVPAGQWQNEEWKSFRNEYGEKFGKRPGMTAVYSYDAANILISALSKARSGNREIIQKKLEETSWKGITGTISFDEHGNRKGNFGVVKIRNGVPAEPE
ncbi:MAG: ABC transporter substrate-binding protein [Bacteroidales bacterium]|jgi:branched-chain amino acid transport system substrate-binding protein|nr:ABC transporter substrate-binding protein [Bacteroidales bacterium]